MKYFKKMVGERIYLSPLNPEDAEQFCIWLNDLEIVKTLSMPDRLFSLEYEKEALSKMSKQNEPSFAVVDLKTDQLIGSCGLFDVNHLNQTAEFGISICDKNYWNQGYGQETLKLLLDFGFNILNLHNIRLKVYSYNKRAIRCYEKTGFKHVAKLRELKQFAGKRHDVLLMDMLASEFESPYVKKVMENS